MPDTDQITVAVTAHELVRAAIGKPVTCRALDGTTVILRLPSVVEMAAEINEARRTLLEQGLPQESLPPMPTSAEIAQLVRPLEVPA